MSKRSRIMACGLVVVSLFSVFFAQSLQYNQAAAEVGGTITRGAITSTDEALQLSGGTLEVIGTASVKVKPDIAVLNIGVTTKGETTLIQAENTKTMNEVMAALKAQGIEEKDIKTINYYMNPNYDYTTYEKTETPKIIGYTVYNLIEVKVRDIDKAGTVLAEASKAGANVNNGISFSLSSSDEYYNEALAKAILNARGKAEAMAGAIGVTVGLPTRVSENYSYYSPTYYGNYNSMEMSNAAMSADAVSVSKGEIEITANVSVSYSY